MNITIKTILHKEQRYRTLGDWWFDDNGDLQIRVSNLSDWRWESIIAMHELDEVILAKCNAEKRGENIKDIEKKLDDFDIAFEKDRPADNEDEPGDDPKNPVYDEHFFATNLEKLRADKMGLDWRAYHYEGLVK